MLDTPGFVGWPKAAVITLVVAQRLCSGAAPSGRLFGRTCGRGVVTWRLAILTARGSFFASVVCKHLQALTGFVNNILSSYRFVKSLGVAFFNITKIIFKTTCLKPRMVLITLYDPRLSRLHKFN